MQAQATPLGAILAFADDGSKPFGKYEDDCQVRMQRVDALLIVEDNGSNGAGAIPVLDSIQEFRLLTSTFDP